MITNHRILASAILASLVSLAHAQDMHITADPTAPVSPSPMAAIKSASARRPRRPVSSPSTLASIAPARPITCDAEETFAPCPSPQALPRRLSNYLLQIEVTVDIDGTHQARLLRGTGNRGADEMIRQSLLQWRWRPALREGVPCRSVRQIALRLTPA